jgi:preprotein translocase subunit SecG
MLFLIILLSVAMVLDCLILTLLVLMQLPKKEAGAGLAFGGAATDALFGAGSGNFLTKATKYAAGIFFALAILLSLLQTYRANQPGSEFQRLLQQQQTAPAITAPPPPSTPAPAMAPASTNLTITTPAVENPVPAVAPSNSAPAP